MEKEKRQENEPETPKKVPPLLINLKERTSKIDPKIPILLVKLGGHQPAQAQPREGGMQKRNGKESGQGPGQKKIKKAPTGGGGDFPNEANRPTLSDPQTRREGGEYRKAFPRAYHPKTAPLNPPPNLPKNKTPKNTEEIFWVSLGAHELTKVPSEDPFHYGHPISLENKEILQALRNASTNYRFSALEQNLADQLIRGASPAFREELLSHYVATVLLYIEVRKKRFTDIRARLKERRNRATHFIDIKTISEHLVLLRQHKRLVEKLQREIGRRGGGTSPLSIPSIVNYLQTCRTIVKGIDDRASREGNRLSFLDRFQ